jgi:hypothetical protein
MRMKYRFAQRSTGAQIETSTSRAAKNRMDAGDLRFPYWELHNFRVTGLCTGCTPLKNKKLQPHEFH